MVPLELPCNGCLILFITYDQGVFQKIRGKKTLLSMFMVKNVHRVFHNMIFWDWENVTLTKFRILTYTGGKNVWCDSLVTSKMGPGEVCV